MLKHICFALTLSFILASTPAFAVVIIGDTADGALGPGGVVNTTREFEVAGWRSGKTNIIYVFDVATLPTGTDLATVSLNATFKHVLNEDVLPTGLATDAYFVGFSSTAAIADDSPAGLVFVESDSGPGIKIADNIVARNDASPSTGTPDVVNTQFEMGLNNLALLTAMQSRETDGTENYAFFRLNVDQALATGTPAQRGFGWQMTEIGAPVEVGDPERRPFLNYTVVPEPGTMALTMLGLTAIALRRRRTS